MNEKLVSFFLRIGLVIVFFYAAVASFLQPIAWIGYFPDWLRNIIDGKILLMLFSVFQILIGLWLLSGKKVYYAAIISSISLLAIIIANISILDIIFRDFAIFFMAIALAVLNKK